MKKLVLPLLLLGLLSSGAQAQVRKAAKPAPPAARSEAPSSSLALGSEIPMDGMVLTAADGPPVNLREAKTEKGLVVMFSCNTCPFVIKAQPKTLEAIEVAKKLGYGMVIVNSNQGLRDSLDSRNAMRAYADQQGYKVPYVIDDMSQLANAFGATRTPEVYLFNAEGKLVYKGGLEDNPADPAKSTRSYLVDALKALDQNKKINPAETKSIGCSIKRLEM